VPRLIGGALFGSLEESLFGMAVGSRRERAVASDGVTLGIEVLSRQTGAGFLGSSCPLVIRVAMIMAVSALNGRRDRGDKRALGLNASVEDRGARGWGAPRMGRPEDGGSRCHPKANWLRLDDSQRRQVGCRRPGRRPVRLGLHGFLCRGGGGLRGVLVLYS